ncbi:MAG: TonB-dependent receptor, partial [Cyanobacteria bacterium P01_H01_bin.58]
VFFQNRDFRIGDDLELPFLGTDIGESTYDQTTYAGFAQLDYKPIEPLTLTAGLRYEYWKEELDRDAQVFQFVNGPTVPSFFFPFTAIDDSTIDGDAWLPRFAVNYQINPNVGVYGSIARGYRPGTHNYIAFTNEELIVDPERSWNYELGLKTSWLNDRLGINLAAFYTDISDLQVLVLDNSLTFGDIFNAEARTLGAELEMRATPFEGFDVIAGVGYTDAKFTDNTNPFTGQSFDGNRLLYAPNYTYNLALQYRNPIGFFGRLEAQGIGTVFFDEANELKEEPYTLVNARIGYEFEDVGIYLFANNLFNTEYVSLAFRGFGSDILAGYGDRRTFGVELRGQF